MPRLRGRQAKILQELRDLGCREPTGLVAPRRQISEDEHAIRVARKLLER
jgi:hypothetical protein